MLELGTNPEPDAVKKVGCHMKRVLAIFATALALSGCASLMSSAATGLTDNLSAAILNQDDPEIVRIGAPSYLLLLDSFVEGSPDNPDILSATATLYATYGVVFADDEARAAKLTSRARTWARNYPSSLPVTPLLYKSRYCLPSVS